VDDKQLKTLADRLYSARHAAVPVDFAEAEIEGAWRPELNKCHEDATIWAAHNDGWEAVRGWIVFDLSDSFLAMQPEIHFVAHSVVRDTAGKLWDITPSTISVDLRFLPHPGTDHEFTDIIEVHKLAFVDYSIPR
jgi:hypothetical protein